MKILVKIDQSKAIAAGSEIYGDLPFDIDLAQLNARQLSALSRCAHSQTPGESVPHVTDLESPLINFCTLPLLGRVDLNAVKLILDKRAEGLDLCAQDAELKKAQAAEKEKHRAIADRILGPTVAGLRDKLKLADGQVRGISRDFREFREKLLIRSLKAAPKWFGKITFDGEAMTAEGIKFCGLPEDKRISLDDSLIYYDYLERWELIEGPGPIFICCIKGITFEL